MVKIDEADSLVSVKQLLSGSWSSSNTSGVRPKFYRNIEQPVGRFDYNFNPANILIYPVSHTNTPNDLGAYYKDATVDRVSIDIRVKSTSPDNTWDLGRKCYNEVRNIISGAVVNNPDSDFQQLMPDVGYQDFSTAGFFRYVLDIKLKNWTVTR